MKIRFAVPADSKALLDIYAQYIETPVTFEYLLPSVSEFAGRIADVSSVYPYLIAEENGAAVGYAYAHRQKEREAYQWNAELSVYLDQSHTSKGIGKILYQILIELLGLQGIRNLYGAVTSPNEKSEKLHLSLGFTRLGAYHSTGYKCGAWHDVQLFERRLFTDQLPPVPILPVSGLRESEINAVIDKYINM